MTVKIYIETDSGVRKWEDIPEEEQKKISEALNRQCLRTLGYEEVKK